MSDFEPFPGVKMVELTCKGCGRIFTRKPQTGRRPFQCQTCRAEKKERWTPEAREEHARKMREWWTPERRARRGEEMIQRARDEQAMRFTRKAKRVEPPTDGR